MELQRKTPEHLNSYLHHPHVVENNTIVENVSFLDGAGVLVWDNVAALQNNIVWGNLPPAAGQISLRFGAGAEGDREEREEIS